MATRKLLASIGAAFALLLSTGCASLEHSAPAAATAAGPNRIVMQVSDAEPAKWNLALNNARNIQSDLGAKNVEIEIVA